MRFFEKPRNSLTMFDLLKGIGIICVIVVHSLPWDIQNTLMGRILMSVLMPMFFVTSGYFMKKKTMEKGIRDSCVYLFKPYIYAIGVIDIISLVHRGIQGQWKEWIQIFLLPGIVVHSGNNTRIGALWFVFALFLAWCIFYLTVQIKNEKYQCVVGVLLGISGGLIIGLEPPLQIGQGLIGAFFVFCGYCIKRKKMFEKSLNGYDCVLLLFAWIPGILFGSMDLAFYDVRYGIFSIISSMAGTYLVIRLALCLNVLECAILDKIRTLGHYSLWILCVHSVEAAVFPWKVLFRMTGETGGVRVLSQIMIRSAMITVGCVLLQRLQKKTKENEYAWFRKHGKIF